MNGISLIVIGKLITRGEQAVFNLEIKKKSESSNDLDIHHSKVFGSDLKIFLNFYDLGLCRLQPAHPIPNTSLEYTKNSKFLFGFQID